MLAARLIRKILAHFRIESAVGDEVIDVSARLEVRIQLDEWSRPETAAGVGSIHLAGDIFGLDVSEASGEPLVLGNEFFTKGKIRPSIAP